MKRHLLSLGSVPFRVVVTAAVLFAGCTNSTTPSLYDQNFQSVAQPAIDSISPAGSVLAGVQPITIYGKNFSSVASNNTVFFNANAGSVVSATTTQMIVNTPADSVTVIVKVAVVGGVDFSRGYSYRLIMGILPVSKVVAPATGAGAVTPDSAGNIIFNLLAAGKDNGIVRITPDEVVTPVGPVTVSIWTSLKVGPGGLYAVKNVRAVYRFPPGGGPATAFKGISSPNTLKDIDFDQNKYLWAGGTANGLYCFKQDASFKITPFTGAVHALRVYGGSLYFSALKDSVEQIFKASINGDTLGAIEPYFNLKTALGSGFAANSMTFSADGYLYAGTSVPIGLIVIAPSGTFSTGYSSYSPLFSTASPVSTPYINSVAWGTGDKIYATTSEGILLVVHTNRTGAPYYGLN